MTDCNTMLSNLQGKIELPQKKDVLIFFLVFLLLPLLFFIVGSFQSVQNLLIALGGMIRGHELDAKYWHTVLSGSCIPLFNFGICFFVIVFSLHFYLHASEKTKNRLLWIFFALSLLVSFITVVFHEQWYDEVHAFHLAKVLGPRSLFRAMGNEGHFLPWFVILAPFAKLNFPVQTLSYISWILNALALLAFVKKASLNPFVKIVVLFTSPFLFWNPVVSRPYVLLALVLFLIAAVYKDRNTHPYLFAFLVGLLSNTHVYIEGLVAVLFFYFLVEDTILPWKNYSHKQRKDHVLALALIVFLVLVAFVQVVPALFGKSPFVPEGIVKFNKLQLWVLVKGSEIVTVLIPLFLICIVLTFVYIFKKDRKSFVILFLSCLWMWLFAVFIYGGCIPNRCLLWFVILVFVFWISEKLDKKTVSFMLIVLSVFIINPGRNARDITGIFSSTGQVAAYIRENYPEDVDVYQAGFDYHLEYLLPDYTVHAEQYEDWNVIKSSVIVVENLDFNGKRIQESFPKNFIMVHDSFWGQSGLPLRVYEIKEKSE